MSTLKTNTISTNDANNVALSNQLNLKSYTTTARDALTSVAGDMIYNTTTNKVQFYNGSAWADTASTAAVAITYLVIGGGGGSPGSTADYSSGGGGGAGGYRTNKSGQTSGANASAEATYYVPLSTNIPVTVGGGGAAGATVNGSSGKNGQTGNSSIFGRVTSLGGGGGFEYYSASTGTFNPNSADIDNKVGLVGSGGGGSWNAGALYVGTGAGKAGQGMNGGVGNAGGAGDGSQRVGGGGGGASTVGTAGASGVGGDGGDGLSSDITGSALTKAGGGGGAGAGSGNPGGSGGGGAGGNSSSATGTAGTANTGGGAGATFVSTGSATGGVTGGSGVVILRWTTADATIGGTRTGLTDGGVQTDDADSYIIFTAGTGNITFS
jgi:hypothetical protein